MSKKGFIKIVVALGTLIGIIVIVFRITNNPKTPVTTDQTSKAAPDGIFYGSSQEYFDLLEGEWRAVEYAGAITDSHCDEMATEEYWKKSQEYTDEVIEENLDREFNISRENLEYFGPYSDWGCSIEDNEILFFVTRFNPGVGENISLTPPYIGLDAQLADTGEDYGFIIDAEGTVLIEIDYRFFRMERSNK